MKQLLAEEASITERDESGFGVLHYAAGNAQYKAMRCLLTEAGASMSEVSNTADHTIWDTLWLPSLNYHAAELSALLRVMVMLEDAPVHFLTRVMPQHVELCRRGRQLRAELTSHLDQQRASIVAHCPLPDVLQSLVLAHATTIAEDMWTGGLCV
jgi:hypothetical protein